jgi:hypothetical protein
VRLDLPQSRGVVDADQVRHAVGQGAPLDLRQCRQFRLVDRDHQLADFAVRQTLLPAVLTDRLPARHAQPGLERTVSVVEARVHHAGVVPGLVRGEPGFLLEDRHLAELPLGQGPCQGDAHDPSADDPYAFTHVR